ncbi:hypothetical protein ACFYS8_30095 [Kitasatospora sp. NPDC004615]|uniref:hypothetical protein n=1 Tax=Kitasatospora sp. NPDC004615 TaxID=3364017 RepID=UPI0036CB450A
MPIPDIRRYTELARTGAGTEPDRLALPRAHEARVLDQLAELQRALDIVRYKVAVYEDYLEQHAG